MTSNDETLRIRVFDDTGKEFNGKVDLTVEYKAQRESRRLLRQSSSDLIIRGLYRLPDGDYEVTVSPSDEWAPVTRQVKIPETGFATLEITLDRRNAPVEQYTVSGTVRQPNGEPATGLTVVAFDRDMRREEQLGESPTDAGGQYQIKFTPKAFARAEKRDPDLLLKVRDARHKVIYDPGLEGVLFNAPPDAVIDIDLPAGATRVTSEIERLQSSVGPLLDGVAVADIQEDAKTKDLTFLTHETAWSGRTLQHWVVAHRLARHVAISPEFF